MYFHVWWRVLNGSWVAKQTIDIVIARSIVSKIKLHLQYISNLSKCSLHPNTMQSLVTHLCDHLIFPTSVFLREILYVWRVIATILNCEARSFYFIFCSVHKLCKYTSLKRRLRGNTPMKWLLCVYSFPFTKWSTITWKKNCK